MDNNTLITVFPDRDDTIRVNARDGEDRVYLNVGSATLVLTRDQADRVRAALTVSEQS